MTLSETDKTPHFPLIMAPAGSKAAFLAALAAGADAIYCGLKHFSARMAATNFSIGELTSLTELAHRQQTKIYITLNTLVKSDELQALANLIHTLNRHVKPDALIVQDIGLVNLVRQVGWEGELHLSTLANVTFPEALTMVQQKMGFDRVVLPRELSIDEIKAMAAACPEDLQLEVFVHGALCYAVSGRCYWSSFMGGKSGLRGRCVQPCRRLYTQGKRSGRFFSCLDLGLDILAKVLRPISEIRAWKIEGRKKSPHYVYYTVSAYRLIRDHGQDSQMKKTALAYLDGALGRPRTPYYFLPQRPRQPVDPLSRTGSGRYVGTVRGTARKPYLSPREALITGDLLRLGYEDQAWHATEKVKRHVPQNGRLILRVLKVNPGSQKIPVFIIDRKEKEIGEEMAALEATLKPVSDAHPEARQSIITLPRPIPKSPRTTMQTVYRYASRNSAGRATGLWLSEGVTEKLDAKTIRKYWWWLPPVTWPEETSELKVLIKRVHQAGAKQFVLNAPWQITLFPGQNRHVLWAGPFCNLSNPLALKTIASLGFSGAIVSPELDRQGFITLPRHAPLPLGVVIEGNWPLAIARNLCDEIKTDQLFTSPKGEAAWVHRYGENNWVYPNWKIDLKAHQPTLKKAGYQLFIRIMEPQPTKAAIKKRPGLWNWELKLR